METLEESAPNDSTSPTPPTAFSIQSKSTVVDPRSFLGLTLPESKRECLEVLWWAVAGGLAIYVYYFEPRSPQWLSTSPLTAGFLVAAGSLTIAVLSYRLRRKFRFVYGIVELLVGIFVAILVFVEPYASTATVMKFILAVYVMVRALDNVEQGLKATRWPWWQKVFGIDCREPRVD